MLVRVTGGMSLDEGGLWALEADAAVCGTRPVRTMGGWSRVEMAFCPDSLMEARRSGREVFRMPPMEPVELAVEVRREWVQPAELDGREGSVGGKGYCLEREIGLGEA